MSKKKRKKTSEEDLSEETTVVDNSAEEHETAAEGELVEGEVEKADGVEEEELQARFLRLQADFENFRKRTIRERSEISSRANENIMLEMLDVLDNLDIALNAAEEHGADPAFVDGFRMVGTQLTSSLGKFGLKQAETEGGNFDPQIHEAISKMPSEDIEEGHVILCHRKGYMLGDRLLRAAQVVVSGGKAPSESEG